MRIPTFIMSRVLFFSALTTSLISLSGCGGKGEPGAGEPATRDSAAEDEWDVEVSDGAGSDHSHGGHAHHHHEAPHGGTLIALGDHFAHLEVIHDATEGRITIYALDGEAENPVRLKLESLVLQIKSIERETPPAEADVQVPVEIHLGAAANPLTGETVGDTSEFSGTAPFLSGPIVGFTAILPRISLLGSDMENIEIKYPEGNE